MAKKGDGTNINVRTTEKDYKTPATTVDTSQSSSSSGGLVTQATACSNKLQTSFVSTSCITTPTITGSEGGELDIRSSGKTGTTKRKPVKGVKTPEVTQRETSRLKAYVAELELKLDDV